MLSALRRPVRVAGYFYLTESGDKTHALDMIRAAVSDRVDSTEEWCYTRSYFDRESTVEKLKKRPSFEMMMEDARAGKFDLLITESIERFAPTAEETMQCTEELRDLPKPVMVRFLKDRIDSETVHSIIPIIRGWRP
jgi:DNA invertase Pin-like site-specific DNA recombinase